MRRIRNTFKELHLGRHWKLEWPSVKRNVKRSIENSFSPSLDIHFRIKPLERCDARCFTNASNTDQSEVLQDDSEGNVDLQTVSTDESPYNRLKNININGSKQGQMIRILCMVVKRSQNNHICR